MKINLKSILIYHLFKEDLKQKLIMKKMEIKNFGHKNKKNKLLKNVIIKAQLI